MTRIEDLTDDQVAELTDDEVDLLIKRRMAEEGVPVLPMPIEPEYLPVPGPEVPLYEVAGVGFTDRDAADAVLAVIHAHDQHRAQAKYEWGVTGYDVRYLERDAQAHQVTTKMFYSQEAYKAHADTLAENKRRKAEYDAAMAEWNKAESDAKEARTSVLNRVERVAEDRKRRAFLTERFREYVGIADGDEAMALQFLVRAFSLDDDAADAVRVAWDAEVAA